MGQVIAMTKCPWHPDKTPSLAIYDNGYYCFGCKKSGKLEPWMTDLVSKQDNRDVYKRSVNVDTFDFTYEEQHRQFFKDRQLPTRLAKYYGIKASGQQLLIPAYDFEGDIHGYQIRNLDKEPKYKSLPYKEQYAKFSWVDFDSGNIKSQITTKPMGCIVESVVDALIMNRLGLPSLALLGTNIPCEVIPFFEGWTLHIVFDPDAIVIASYLQDVISAYGIATNVVDLPDKPYKINLLQLGKEIYKEEL
jgi:hypothetical protein